MHNKIYFILFYFYWVDIKIKIMLVYLAWRKHFNFLILRNYQKIKSKQKKFYLNLTAIHCRVFFCISSSDSSIPHVRPRLHLFHSTLINHLRHYHLKMNNLGFLHLSLHTFYHNYWLLSYFSVFEPIWFLLCCYHYDF